jgi:RNA polymerase sigma factor (sigma-70 family)
MTKIIPFYSTEYDLARALLRQEERAFGAFYERYSAKLLAICCRYVADRMAAEDVMVEGIMRVFDKIGQFGFHGSFEGWAKRIIVNEALMYLRKQKVFEVPFEQAQHVFYGQEPSDGMEIEGLINLINELPVGYKTVFNLYAIEGYSHSEIAELLHISEGTSKSQLSRARALLQEKIKTLDLIKHQ